jgi:hypothetical protein
MTPQAQGLRGLARRLPPGPADLRRTAGIEDAVRRLLLGGVMPLWIGAGLADWYLHRRTRIEDTAGKARPAETSQPSAIASETSGDEPAAVARRRVGRATAFSGSPGQSGASVRKNQRHQPERMSRSPVPAARLFVSCGGPC